MLKKVELLANVAVLVTTLLLCSILIKKYLLPNASTVGSVHAVQSKTSSTNTPNSQRVQIGTKISVPGVNWSQSPRTVLLALSTSCHFCSESAPFYQRLQQQKPNDVRIIAVLPQSPANGQNYLESLGVSVSEVFQAPLASISVSGTPTMMLIDRNGIVKDSWIGKLGDDRQAEIITALNANTAKE